MLPHRSSLLLPSGSAPLPPDRSVRNRIFRRGALTLVEVMFALVIQATVMLAIIGSFIQSRRVTEGSVLHAAATSMVYGIIEQIKQLDYVTQLPNFEVDPSVPPTPTPIPVPPYVRVRIDQGTVKWLMVVYTPAAANGSWNGAAPTTTPVASATAASVGAIDNQIGNIPLSTVTGSISQSINLNMWIWVDEIASSGTWAVEGATLPSVDAAQVKRVTIVYTYQYRDGNSTRTIRDREVFVRTRYD